MMQIPTRILMGDLRLEFKASKACTFALSFLSFLSLRRRQARSHNGLFVSVLTGPQALATLLQQCLAVHATKRPPLAKVLTELERIQEELSGVPRAPGGPG
jgi:hypothetical protein